MRPDDCPSCRSAGSISHGRCGVCDEPAPPAMPTGWRPARPAVGPAPGGTLGIGPVGRLPAGPAEHGRAPATPRP